MARAETNKLYNDFTKGLITEAGYLTYPEDASIDESNTVISRKGNRTRRVGVDYESGYTLENLGVGAGESISEFVWTSADNNPLFNFTVVQVGHIVYFYRMDEGPISNGLQVFSLDLTEYAVPGITSGNIRDDFVSFSEGAGFMFIAHRLCDPLSIEYDPDTNTITVIRVIIQIRDFDGVYDGLANDQEPSSLSVEHHYNLLNQGWITPGTSTVSGGGYSGGVLSDQPIGFGGLAAPWTTVYINPFTGNVTSYVPTTSSETNEYYGQGIVVN